MASPTSTKLPVGTILSGKYKITREIGRGGMAAVYEAENIDIGKRIAIKVLAQELTTSMVVVERFFREARAAAAIRSPYICDVYDSGRLEDGPPFLVLELLEGESLYERMTKVRYFDVPTTLAIITQVCRGLTKAHAANIVHRDLKPENIFLGKDEDGQLLAKILDFGLAKFYTPLDGSGGPQQARLTREGAVFGTPAYMSPEQVRGQGAVDHRADLWALACIVYECFTGRTVWQTEQGVAMTFAQIASAQPPDPLVYRPDLPPSFKAWFDKALDRKIDHRFQTAREFAEELSAAFETVRPEFSGLFPTDQLSSLGRTVPAPPPSKAGLTATGSDLPMVSMAPPSSTMPNPFGSMPPPSVRGGPTSEGGSPRHTKSTFEAPPGTLEPLGPGLSQAPPRPRTAALGIVTVLVLVALVGGGYAAWSKFGPASKGGEVETSSSAMPSGSASAVAPHVSASSSVRPVSSSEVSPSSSLLPWRPLVADAQATLATGDHKGALKLLKDAFDKGGHGVPRTMLEHVQVAISGDASKSPCTLTGLARPRSYDLGSAQPRRVAAGRPWIALGPRGPIMVWTDTHEGPEHAFAVALDEALRPLSDPIDVTPEAGAVTRPVVTAFDDQLVLLYADGHGAEAGVHARLLDPDGRIGGPMVNIAPLRGPSSGTSMQRAADGTFVVAWTAETETGNDELFLRKLSPKLEPQGEAVRATDFVPTGPQKPRVRSPMVGIAGDAAHVSFRLERTPNQVAYHMRLPLADVGKGVEARKKGDRNDRWIGDTIVVNTDKSKADMTGIACSKDACFLVWDGESNSGVSAAYLDAANAQPLWRDKRFSKVGGHPSVGVDASGNARIVWFEKGGVMTAPISRDGVGPSTKIARVSGAQPSPAIITGKAPGEWFIAWLDFEAGQLEPYAARFVCK
ncbi:serine/threonine protein kinase [Polyangium fumosum]|uniref:Serine/threonine protein kinase n=1 Tax=Polyangium fumosum TaxID=889272 RepID=A0A4U1JBY5_9BACT|nr:serine/threonine-protein kinase [Polyangium fumosum]TKD07350.1 serine/threonine protein kinase [Polyangium fumosum]